MTENRPYPLGQCTTSELAAYKRDLERAVRDLPEAARARMRLQDKLRLVADEEESRRALAERNGR